MLKERAVRLFLYLFAHNETELHFYNFFHLSLSLEVKTFSELSIINHLCIHLQVRKTLNKKLRRILKLINSGDRHEKKKRKMGITRGVFAYLTAAIIQKKETKNWYY